MRTLIILLLCLTSLLLSSCQTPTYHFDQDASVNLKQYKKFAWLRDHDKEVGDVKYQSLTAKRVIHTVETELKNKGMSKVALADADFLINIQNKTERKISVQSSPSFGSSYHYRRFSGHISNYDLDYYNEYTLIVDFIDPDKKQTIWTAVAEDYELSQESLTETLKYILKNFPEKVKK